jgi:hypothetical protein
VRAEQLRVPQDFPTIQAAIDAATEGDSVILADGLYAAAGNRDLEFHGKGIVVASANGPAACVIDCSDENGTWHRAFRLGENEPPSAAIIGLTIINGMELRGGAILCENDASPLIAGCVFRNNRAQKDGGAIAVIGGEALIRDCLFEFNQASLGGCLRSRHCCGWGIGGAIALLTTDSVVERCVIAGNRSVGSGGGIGVQLANPSIPQPPESFSPVVKNCLITRNVARAGDGGGLACYAGSPLILNCTLVANFSQCPGGGLAGVFDVRITVRNSVLHLNSGGFGGDHFTSEFGAVLDFDECTVVGGSASGFVDETSTLIWGAENLVADPQFVELPNSGEDGEYATPDDLPGDLRLTSGSPSIDAVAASFVPPADERDLDGRVRRWDGDNDGVEAVDMGAYEFGAPAPGDLDGDCAVGLQDLTILLSNFGDTSGVNYSNGDLDADGDVDLSDLTRLLSVYGTTCP